jgi:CRISPR-associated protein Csd1
MRFIDPREKTENEVYGVLKKAITGEPIDEEGLNPQTPFRILCLSPNAARLSVRFFHQDSFGSILSNLAAHYRRMEIDKAPHEVPYISLYWLLKATVFEQSKEDAASPLLAGAVLRAIVSGTRYPDALYSNILMRIRAEQKVDRTKAAIVKAYLTRNSIYYEENKEVITVALNEASTNKPYVLGRLFALLEQTQESANPGINSTITDKYFDSACSTPRLAFPTLLRLSRHHIAKDDKWGWRNEKLIGEIIDLLEADNDPYPAHLTPEEQGLFILGYYHQRQARFKKKDNVEATKKNEEEN